MGFLGRLCQGEGRPRRGRRPLRGGARDLAPGRDAHVRPLVALGPGRRLPPGRRHRVGAGVDGRGPRRGRGGGQRARGGLHHLGAGAGSPGPPVATTRPRRSTWRRCGGARRWATAPASSTPSSRWPAWPRCGATPPSRARLLSAADAHRILNRCARPVPQQAEHDADQALARAGCRPARSIAWAEGHGLSRDEAVALALGPDEATFSSGPGPVTTSAPGGAG